MSAIFTNQILAPTLSLPPLPPGLDSRVEEYLRNIQNTLQNWYRNNLALLQLRPQVCASSQLPSTGSKAGSIYFASDTGELLFDDGTDLLPACVPAYTVATLPTSPGQGQLAVVTDGASGAAWRDAPTGGGSTNYLVWYRGSAWSIFG